MVFTRGPVFSVLLCDLHSLSIRDLVKGPHGQGSKALFMTRNTLTSGLWGQTRVDRDGSIAFWSVRDESSRDSKVDSL